MIRVISSPSSSTTGLATLIFGMEQRAFESADQASTAQRGSAGGGRPGSRAAGRRGGGAAGRRSYDPAGAVLQAGLCVAKRGGQAAPETLHRARDIELGAAMPGAGTDKTKRWTRSGGPVVILVEPQLAENVGTTARAMANFGLERLRLVKPREDPLSPRARAAASGADLLLERAERFEELASASSKRSSSSARRKSAGPWSSTCATFFRACRPVSRMSARSTA